MTERTCSYVVPATQDEVSGAKIASHPCGKPAKWEMWGSMSGPYTFVDACTDHVGHLLDDSPATTVNPIRERGMAGDPGLPKMR